MQAFAKRLLFAALLVLPISSANAITWYIREDGSGTVPRIQDGIDLAFPGDTVLVAAGNYTWTTQGSNESIDGLSMLEMKSGVFLISEFGAEETILDAESEGRVVRCSSVSDAWIEGFTIRGGDAKDDDGMPSGAGEGWGGGIFIRGSSALTIANSIIANNMAKYVGAGMVVDHSTAVVRSNLIYGNSASIRSGGIEVVWGTLETEIKGNTIVGNAGGGITCISGTATISDNILAENTVGGVGGGYALKCFESSPVVSCNNVWNNEEDNSLCGADVFDNVFLDPLFCDPQASGTGNFLLRSDSPCLPQNNTCATLIGARGEGCTVTTAGGDFPPKVANLLWASPNPFNPSTKVTYSAKAPGLVDLTIFDHRGRAIRNLVHGMQREGEYSVTWAGIDKRGASVASGVYVARLIASGEVQTTTLVLTK